MLQSVFQLLRHFHGDMTICPTRAEAENCTHTQYSAAMCCQECCVWRHLVLHVNSLAQGRIAGCLDLRTVKGGLEFIIRNAEVRKDISLVYGNQNGCRL